MRKIANLYCREIFVFLIVSHCDLTFNGATVTDSEDSSTKLQIQTTKIVRNYPVVALHFAFSVVFDEAPDTDSDVSAELRWSVRSIPMGDHIDHRFDHRERTVQSWGGWAVNGGEMGRESNSDIRPCLGEACDGYRRLNWRPAQ